MEKLLLGIVSAWVVLLHPREIHFAQAAAVAASAAAVEGEKSSIWPQNQKKS
jgi:hypothetical protein